MQVHVVVVGGIRSAISDRATARCKVCADEAFGAMHATGSLEGGSSRVGVPRAPVHNFRHPTLAFSLALALA